MLALDTLQMIWGQGERNARHEHAGALPREGAWPAFERLDATTVLAGFSPRDKQEAKTVFTTAYLSEWDYITQNGEPRGD